MNISLTYDRINPELRNDISILAFIHIFHLFPWKMQLISSNFFGTLSFNVLFLNNQSINFIHECECIDDYHISCNYFTIQFWLLGQLLPVCVVRHLACHARVGWTTGNMLHMRTATGQTSSLIYYFSREANLGISLRKKSIIILSDSI